jgi:transposase
MQYPILQGDLRVAKSFIQKLIKQYKETGDIHPHPQGVSPEPKLKKEQLIVLL